MVLLGGQAQVGYKLHHKDPASEAALHYHLCPPQGVAWQHPLQSRCRDTADSSCRQQARLVLAVDLQPSVRSLHL